MFRKIYTFIQLVLATLVFAHAPALAQVSSQNFRADETYFGIGGELDLSSPNYKTQQSAGGFGNNVSSANNRSTTGFLTPGEPYIEMAVTGADVDLGVLSTIATASVASQGGDCNCTFSVRTYLSSTYVVQTVSNPPTNEAGHSLLGKPTQGASSIGTEEFGINLVANTSPATFGANPVNQPNNTFADGEAASGYSVANQYKYVVGDTIARSAKTAPNEAIGQTDYTVSYIANISSLTRSGLYQMDHDLVLIATF